MDIYIFIISNVVISPFISPRDMVCINSVTLILENISQCDVTL